ncbi:MAG: transposase [Thermoanaerobaculia bacterium]
MSRRLRFIPDGGALVEVTCRTLHSRFLLRPSRPLDEIIVGILGRAQRRYKMRICGYMFASSHYHLLLDVDDAHQLAQFMCYVGSNIAREAGRLHRWREKIWGRRYEAIVVSNEEGAQIARLKYLLANGCKEGLVARPQDWPGVHVAKALLQGEDAQGYWFDRTQEYAARNRGEKFDRLQYASVETLRLSPLPCWKHLSSEIWRGRAIRLIHEIVEETAARRARSGSEPLGAAAILGRHPHERPKNPKRSPAPLFHALSAGMRRELWEAYRLFVAAFRQAADKLRAGDRNAVFPPGSFPPALPFVDG